MFLVVMLSSGSVAPVCQVVSQTKRMLFMGDESVWASSRSSSTKQPPGQLVNFHAY